MIQPISSKLYKTHSADFGDIRLLAGFEKTGPVRESYFFHTRYAACEKSNFHGHPLQSLWANAPKSANCYVHFIPGIIRDQVDDFLTIFHKNQKNK